MAAADTPAVGGGCEGISKIERLTPLEGYLLIGETVFSMVHFDEETCIILDIDPSSSPLKSSILISDSGDAAGVLTSEANAKARSRLKLVIVGGGSYESRPRELLIDIVRTVSAIYATDKQRIGFYFLEKNKTRAEYPVLFSSCPISEGVEPMKNYASHVWTHRDTGSKLFLGSKQHAADIEALRQMKIKFILNCTPDLLNLMEDDSSCEYFRIPVEDLEDVKLGPFFEAASDFIERGLAEGRGSVFVHCHQGISRSVSFVLAWLLISRRITNLDDAIGFIRHRRWLADPNKGFIAQLRKIEDAL